MSGRPPRTKTISPSTSPLDMMLSGEGFGLVPLEGVPEPAAGSFGELFAKVEATGAEFRRLAELEPDLIRARNMLDGREILTDRAEDRHKLLGYCMIRFCSLAEYGEVANFAHLVRDTCVAMKLSDNRSYLEGLVGPVAFTNFEKYSKGLTADDGLRKAGRKALAAVGMTWKELRAKLSSGERGFETDDETG